VPGALLQFVTNPTEGQRSESHVSSPEAPFSISGGKQVATAHQISADEGSLLPSARATSLLVLWVLLHVQDNQGSTGLHRGDVSRSLGFVLSVVSLQLPTVR